MSKQIALRVTLIAATAIGTAQFGRAQESNAAKKSAAAAAPPDAGAAARYCSNVGPAVAEIRLARQSKRLQEVEAEVKQRIEQLTQAEANAREWVGKREAMMQKANESMVAIFSKMVPEAAAARLATLDDDTAVAVLAKLPARAAGAILNEMEVERAGKLTGLLSPGARTAKKS